MYFLKGFTVFENYQKCLICGERLLMSRSLSLANQITFRAKHTLTALSVLH